jgi:dUTP pyrophosphatase
MEIAGKFEKVSRDIFIDTMQSIVDKLPEVHLNEMYDNIVLPKISENGMGYDFFSPFPLYLCQGQDIIVPTGIKCNLNGDWMLSLVIDPMLGRKYLYQLSDSVHIVGQNYNQYHDGEIMLGIYRNTNATMRNRVEYGATITYPQPIAQGYFVKCGMAEDNNTDTENNEEE